MDGEGVSGRWVAGKLAEARLAIRPSPDDVRLEHNHFYAAAGKRVVDIIGALALIIIFIPLFVAIGVLVPRDGGILIYSHTRIGKGGKKFKCHKFRTMRPDADAQLVNILATNQGARLEWELKHKLSCDPRITRIGRFLRRTSLDELPQLWNVLCGEMSLVGPRPIVEAEVYRYGRYYPLYLSCKPGLTGMWQVSGRNDVSYRRRVALDVYYARAYSFPVDCLVLFWTVGVMFARCGL